MATVQILDDMIIVRIQEEDAEKDYWPRVRSYCRATYLVLQIPVGWPYYKHRTRRPNP